MMTGKIVECGKGLRERIVCRKDVWWWEDREDSSSPNRNLTRRKCRNFSMATVWSLRRTSNVRYWRSQFRRALEREYRSVGIGIGVDRRICTEEEIRKEKLNEIRRKIHIVYNLLKKVTIKYQFLLLNLLII